MFSQIFRSALCRIKSKSGFSFTIEVIALLVSAVLIFALTKWYIQFSLGVDDLDKRLEMQRLIEDSWKQVNAATQQEFEKALDSLGASRTQTLTVGGHYKLTIKYGAKGTYSGSTCTNKAPSKDDRLCVPATVTIVDNNDSKKTMSFSTHKVFAAEKLSEVAELNLDYSKAVRVYQRGMAMKSGDSYYTNNITNSSVVDFLSTSSTVKFVVKKDGLFQFIVDAPRSCNLSINGSSMINWDFPSDSPFPQLYLPTFLLKGDVVSISTISGACIIVFVPYKNAGSLT